MTEAELQTARTVLSEMLEGAEATVREAASAGHWQMLRPLNRTRGSIEYVISLIDSEAQAIEHGADWCEIHQTNHTPDSDGDCSFPGLIGCEDCDGVFATYDSLKQHEATFGHGSDES